MSGTLAATEMKHEQHDALYKQLSIMEDIIKSSVTDSAVNQLSKIGRIDSMYLREQGVVFTVDLSSGNRQWREYNFNFSVPEMPPMPDMHVQPIAPEVNQEFQEKYQINVNETVAQAMDSATAEYEIVREFMEHNRDKVSELRDQQRELTYSLRDIEREKRDLNFQLSRASDDHKAKLKKALDKLLAQEETVQAKNRKVSELVNKATKAQQAEKMQREQERKNYNQQLTLRLTETLCLYGNGLKALPKNEHVSVILKSAGDKSAGRYKDQVLVFTKQDIASCSADKISAATLMKKSQMYQF